MDLISAVGNNLCFFIFMLESLQKCYVDVFKGYVELVIHPLTPNLQRVCINSKQCRIF